MKGWWFSPPDGKLGYKDGRIAEVGVTHTVDCEPVICRSGLHWSESVIDALGYAKTSTVFRVIGVGEIVKGSDKCAGQSREYLAEYDLSEILLAWARWCALQNIELIKPYTNNYDLIVEFLETGNGAKAAARAAAAAAWEAWEAEAEEQEKQESKLLEMITEKYGPIP